MSMATNTNNHIPTKRTQQHAALDLNSTIPPPPPSNIADGIDCDVQEKDNDDFIAPHFPSPLDRLLSNSGLDPNNDPRLCTPRHSAFLIDRALKSCLAVVDFPSFCATLEEAFDVQCDAGETAQYIAPLAKADVNLRGAACCTVDGQRWQRGASRHAFTVQSISKIVSYGIALSQNRKRTLDCVGVEPSGAKFNELILKPRRMQSTTTSTHHNDQYIPHNPLINAGAIKIAEIVYGDCDDASEKHQGILQYWTLLQSGITPTFSNTVFLAEKATAFRNYALTYLMKEHGSLPRHADVDRIVSDYLNSCSLESTCDNLAVLAATLANHGVNPLTKQRVFDHTTTRDILTVMASAGLYDASGAFMSLVGCPAKSGVAGGIILIIPGVAGLCAFSPRLDEHGNSAWAGAFYKQVFTLNPQFGLFSPVPSRSSHAFSDSTHVMAMTLFACFHGDVERILQLAARGVDVATVSDYDGRTSLHVAVAANQLTIVDLLLRFGADSTRKDRFGHSPLDDARNAVVVGGMTNDIVARISNTQHVPAVMTDQHRHNLSRRESFEIIPKAAWTSPSSHGMRQDEVFAWAVTGDVNVTPTHHDLKNFLARHGLSCVGNDHAVQFDQLPVKILDAIKGDLIIPCFSRFRKMFDDICMQVATHASNENVVVSAAQYSPVLMQVATTSPNKFEASVITVDAQTHTTTVQPSQVSLQAVFEPFAFAFALQKFGLAEISKYCDVEPSGKGFSHVALMDSGKAFNPLVNAGGLAICAMLLEHETEFLHMWQRLVGSNTPVVVLQDVLEAERRHCDKHLATALLMRGRGTWPSGSNSSSGTLDHVQRVIDFYFRLCSIACTVEQIARAASCLAWFGRLPDTGERIFDAQVVRTVLRVMFSCGLAEESGGFMFECGLPAKCGVSGLVLAVVPNLAGFSVLSPLVNECGNSIRGVEFYRRLSHTCHFHAFGRAPLTSFQFDCGLSADNMEELNLFAFLEAAARGDEWEIRNLLSRDMNVSSCDYDGRTALHVAMSESSFEVVKILIQAGANVDVKDRWGNTPRDVAKNVGGESYV